MAGALASANRTTSPDLAVHRAPGGLSRTQLHGGGFVPRGGGRVACKVVGAAGVVRPTIAAILSYTGLYLAIKV